MRINKYIAHATGMSRRAADTAIFRGRVRIGGVYAQPGDDVDDTTDITLDGAPIKNTTPNQTIILNKPAGYVVSRDGQGSRTIYDLLPPELHQLKPVGRLDKDSSGLLIITSDGTLAHELTHPSYQKTKRYQITLNRALTEPDWQKITGPGVYIGEGRPSKLTLKPSTTTSPDSPKVQGQQSQFAPNCLHWIVSMSEGRNRQIRRTFSAQDYTVTRLHRTNFGSYSLGRLKPAAYSYTANNTTQADIIISSERD